MSPKVTAICFLLIATFQAGEQRLMPPSFMTRPGLSQEECPSSSIRSGDRDANTCEEIFTSLGPFCSMVVVTSGNIQRCADGYSEETCNFCLSLQQKCGSLVGSVADICMSRNARECSFEFLRSCSNGRGSDTDCNYCEVVFSICKQLPSVSPTAATIDELSFCSMTFASIGPFCQYVLQPNNDNCQDGFSTSTCNTCRNILQACNNYSLARDTEDICLSNMAYSCAFSQPDSTTFLVEYCSVIQALCSKQLSGSGVSSGSSVGSGSGSGVSGSGSAVSGSGIGSASGSGSGDQCYSVRNTFGQLCTAVLQSPACELAYSRDTCDICQLIASMCAPLDSNVQLFCEQQFIDCESIINDCFSGTESSFQCDYCAFYANNCFRGREVELCDITDLLTGCNRALNTGYPCICFFTIEICTLCNNLQLICPPDITTMTDPTQTITQEPTTVSESTVPTTSITEERTFTEPSTTTFPTTTGVQTSTTILDLTTTAIPPSTPPPSTTMTTQEVPVVTLALEDLTMSQQDNAITTVFRGLEEDQFNENGVNVFREQIALLVSTYEGTLRQKRQLAQVSPNDVLLIGSPVMFNNELVIAFVVVGQNGEPINGSILETAVEEGGNQLASALSIATGASVEFIGVVEGIHSAIMQPLTTTSIVLSQLPDGAIAAIVLIVVLVTVISIVVVVIVLVMLVRQRSRRRKYTLDKPADTSRVTNTYQAVDKLGAPLEDEQPLHQDDVCLQEKSESLTVPSTAYIESNPAALDDDQEVQKSDDAAVKDTST